MESSVELNPITTSDNARVKEHCQNMDIIPQSRPGRPSETPYKFPRPDMHLWGYDQPDTYTLEGVVDALCHDVRWTACRQLCDFLSLSESPIETKLLMSLVANGRTYARELHLRAPNETFVFQRNGIPAKNVRQETCRILPQFVIGKYRVDVLIEQDFDIGYRVGYEEPIWRTYRCVVECDGHDFHEKTKQQASRDRERDRYIQSQGYRVLHFSGAEIHASSFGCAVVVYDQLWGDFYKDRDQFESDFESEAIVTTSDTQEILSSVAEEIV